MVEANANKHLRDLAAAILNFYLPISKSSLPDSAIVFLDPENTGIGISLLCSIEAETQVHPVWQPLSSISHFWFQYRAFLTSPLTFSTPKTWGGR
jgi:hypothetical protein